MASDDKNNTQEVEPEDVDDFDEASLEVDDTVVIESDSEEKAADPNVEVEVDFATLKKIVEGAIFAAAKPMTIDQLGNLFPEDVTPTNDEFRSVLESLMEDYAERGVKLKQVSSGYRFQATEDVGPWISRMWEEKPARYSRALLETLALIAYRQPITRGEIEEIRGVSTSSHIMKTLQEREWVRIVGHRDVPGRPAMYATTRSFLDYFNLKNIDELPSLSEIRDLDEINRELDLAAGITPEAAPESIEESELALAPDVDGQEAEADQVVEEGELLAQADAEMAAEAPDSGTNDQQTEAESN